MGIENAAPDDIWEALSKARASLAPSSGERTKERYKNSYEESHKEQYKDTHKEGYDMSLLVKWNLVGESNSRKRREVFCDNLGIGYSNAKGLLKKLNQYEINQEEIASALSSIYCNDILEEK